MTPGGGPRSSYPTCEPPGSAGGSPRTPAALAPPAGGPPGTADQQARSASLSTRRPQPALPASPCLVLGLGGSADPPPPRRPLLGDPWELQAGGAPSHRSGGLQPTLPAPPCPARGRGVRRGPPAYPAAPPCLVPGRGTPRDPQLSQPSRRGLGRSTSSRCVGLSYPPRRASSPAWGPPGGPPGRSPGAPQVPLGPDLSTQVTDWGARAAGRPRSWTSFRLRNFFFSDAPEGPGAPAGPCYPPLSALRRA